jgi:hypothetical protein
MAATGDTEQELRFEVGKTFLVCGRYSFNHNYQEVYVEKITEYAYKFRKERTDGTWYSEWVGIADFPENHYIVEFLEKPSTPPPLKNDEIKVEINNPEYVKALTTFCPICNGTGRVPDEGSTAGDKACPKCQGSGLIYAVQ